MVWGGRKSSVLYKRFASALLKRDDASPALTPEEEQIREVCESSFYAFVREAWPHCEGGGFVDGMHIHAVCNHLQAMERGEITRLIINQPPRTTKSLLTAVFFPAWLFLRDPSDSVMSVSYAKQLSVRDSTKCRRLIQSGWYQKLWGHRVRLTEDMNQKVRFDTTSGGYRIATSIGSATTGEGANWVLCVPGDTRLQVLYPGSSTPCDVCIEDVVRAHRDVRPDEPTPWRVASFNHETGRKEFRKIKAAHRSLADELVQVQVQGQKGLSVLELTPEHPVFVKGRGYIPAADVHVGDRTVFRTVIRGVEPVMKPEPIPVFNIEVEGNNNYFANNILVHNCDDPNSIHEMRSPVYREKCTTYFDEVLSTRRLADPNRFRMVVVQQRCFVPGTRIRLPHSELVRKERAIETFVPGMRVLSYNLERGQVEPGVVTAVHRHQAPHRFIVQLEQEDGSFILCTKNHKFWSQSVSSFVEAGGLTDDDVLFRLDDSGLDVDPWAVRVAGMEPYSGLVYDLTVEPHHNYFAESLLVSNSHAVDVSGHVLSKKDDRWIHLRLPMEYEADDKCRTVPLFDPATGTVKVWEDPRRVDGELLWPEMLGADDVRLLKEKDFRGDPYLVAGQLQQRPSTRGGQIFRDEWFPVWTWPGYPPFEYVVASWDTALTGKSSSAFSACVVFGIFRNALGVQNSMIVSVYRERIEFPELKDMAARLYKNCFDTNRVVRKDWPGAFVPDVVLVEGKASGYSLVQELGRMGLPVMTFDPGRYGDKETRARRVSDVCEAGQVWFNSNGMGEIPDEFGQMMLKELRVFPSGETMDVVDAFSQGLIHLKERNLLYLHGHRASNT